MIEGLKVPNKWGPISGSPIVNVSRVPTKVGNSRQAVVKSPQKSIRSFSIEALTSSPPVGKSQEGKYMAGKCPAGKCSQG